MKIGSINIRGLGSSVKKDKVSSFFDKYGLDMCCVQETKLEEFLDSEGSLIWKSAGVRWCSEGVVGGFTHILG